MLQERERDEISNQEKINLNFNQAEQKIRFQFLLFYKNHSIYYSFSLCTWTNPTMKYLLTISIIQNYTYSIESVDQVFKVSEFIGKVRFVQKYLKFDI